MKNVGASVYAKLKNAAKAEGMETIVFLRRYVQERLLYRLSVSGRADEFCLKGGILLAAYNDGDLLRPTEDIDFNGFDGDGDVQRLEAALREIMAIEVEDGVTFDLGSMRILKDRTGIVPGGKVSMIAMVHTARVDLKVDVGFGNAVTPDARLMEIPTLLPGDVPRPRINSYPLETVIAEKLHAMAQFGYDNTRVKDHFDILMLSRRQEFDGDLLVRAIRRTFGHQRRQVPESFGCLTPEYARAKAAKWEELVETAQALTDTTFPEAMEELAAFLNPLVESARDVAAPPGLWSPARGWDEGHEPEATAGGLPEGPLPAP